jgi:hypothetical protein
MAFDVTPTLVRGRGQRIPAIAVVAGGIAVVVIAIATASPTPPGSAASSAAPGAQSGAVSRMTPATRVARSPTLGPPASPSPGGPADRPRQPRVIQCHGLGDTVCIAVVRATVAVLPADVPAVTRIDAWDSILCGDNLDCPPHRLAGSEPMGSAVVSFAAGGTQAWVNVVEPSPTDGGDGTAQVPVAWIVRWLP